MEIRPENIIDIKYDDNPISYCRRYLESKISVYKIGPQQKEILFCGMDMIENCISSMETNSKPHDGFKYSDIEKGLNILTSLITENKNEKFFDKFIYDYTFLAHNVNMNTVKNEVVKSKCEYLERFVHRRSTFNETLIMFNMISNKLSEWKKYVPPSFKLSEHYFKVIKEE